MSDASRDPIVSDWRGAARYQCPLCAFDTLNEELIVDHLRGAHPLPEGGEPTPAATDGPPEPEVVSADAPESTETNAAVEPESTPAVEPESAPEPALPTLAPEPAPEPEAAVSHWATDAS